MSLVCETKRLILREWCVDDAKVLFKLQTDPEIIKYTGESPMPSLAHTIEFLEKYDQYAKNGFGRWLVVIKEDNTAIGWCGLKNDKDFGEIDLGYRFLKPYWGRGYASESALAALKTGFEKYNMNRITARVAKENTASEKVLIKIGMTYWKDEFCHEHPARAYKWRKKSLRNLTPNQAKSTTYHCQIIRNGSFNFLIS